MHAGFLCMYIIYSLVPAVQLIVWCLPVFDVIHVNGPNLQLLLDLLDALHLDVDHPDHVLHGGLATSVAQLAPQLPHLGTGSQK